MANKRRSSAKAVPYRDKNGRFAKRPPAKPRKPARKKTAPTSPRVRAPTKSVPRGTLSRRPTKRKKLTGPKRVKIPIKFHDLDSYLEAIEERSDELNLLKSDDEYFSFSFYGGHSYAYDDIGVMASHLRNYQSVEQADDEEKELDVFNNLEIFKFGNLKDWEYPHQKQQKRSAQRRRDYQKKFRDLMTGSNSKAAVEYRKKRAEKERRYRAKLKGKDKKLYKLAAKQRAQHSRDKAEAYKAALLKKRKARKKK